jgi:outer membrane protein insertion porin family
MFNIFNKIIIFIFCFSLFVSSSFSEIVNKIVTVGNDRISSNTIIMFTNISINDDLDSDKINEILKNLYETNFFNDVSVSFTNNILSISVKENPLVENINFKGIEADKIKDEIKKNLNLKERSSFSELILKKDKNLILNNLKTIGFHFAKVEIYVENLSNNKVNITYDVTLGDKAKIKKISFLGNKVFKDSKLKNIIVSEEYKFWKFISGKKYLNISLVKFDKRLLKNFYLNNGYHDVLINSSFAKLIDKNEFELIFNIDAKNKFYFGDIDLKIPNNFDINNFEKLLNLFDKIKGQTYSINSVNEILEEIDNISLDEQYEAITASVNENIISDKINLSFVIEETDKYIIKKINIFGNNVTRENVIRNQLEIDEGDFYNELLQKKSENNLKSLGFFKDVKLESLNSDIDGSKIININVDEKPTGEISAGAGFGTSGAMIQLGIRENNYLGKGVALDTNITINDNSLRGIFSVTDPNYKNSDTSLYTTIEASELDRLTAAGYKNNRTGLIVGTNFEYLDDLNLGLGLSNYYEDIKTISTASATQKKQAGSYWDSFLKLNLLYDKRNQRYKASKGFVNSYKSDIPLISKTNTFTNSFETKLYSELYENNISTISFLVRSSNSISGDEIKLSERLFVPSNKLRGFERGKIGPKDGSTYIGGNFMTSINIASTLPQILEDSQNIDFLVFLDAANLWGVDYNSSLESNDSFKSSIGIGMDWFTPVGPLNFSLALPITKDSSDITETFRFNLGTTF